MPINKAMMKSLKKEYGEKGEKVYFAIENKQKKSKVKLLPKKK